MTTLQKRKKLIEKAEKLTDSDFIDYLLRLIELETSSDSAKVFPLTKMEKKANKKSETDIKEGKLINEEQANEQIESWL